MSEYAKDGSKAFAHGYEKLAFYFDKDKNGIIEGSELNGLNFWVDDGDALTQAGELKSLSEYGITKIIIPDGNETLASNITTKKQLISVKSQMLVEANFPLVALVIQVPKMMNCYEQVQNFLPQ